MTDFQKQQELEQVWFELQRVRAVSRCQSVMSKYVFRLATGDLTGCADLWAKRDDSRVEMSWAYTTATKASVPATISAMWRIWAT